MIAPEYYESDLFKGALRDMTRGMEDHQYKHYNSSMGCMIHSKEHYIHELKARGMVPYDETERLAEEWDRQNPQKEYGDINPKAKEILRSIKNSADKDGNIKLGSRAIEALVEIGAIKPMHQHTPEGYIGAQ